MTLAWAWLSVLTLAAPAGAADPVERVGDVLQTGEAAWAEEGFRLALRGGWESVRGLQGAPSGAGIFFALYPQVRLSRFWSAGLQLQYTLLSGGTSGVRVSSVVAAAWHPWRGLELELGGGYAGQLVNDCYGIGAIGQTRLGYRIAVGELFATGPVLQADLSALRCGGRWRPQQGWHASWAFVWR